MLVTKYNKENNTTDWTLKDINTAMNFFGNRNVEISPKGSIYIGRITMQRKGAHLIPQSCNLKLNLVNYLN
jgi:hypothetical protein